MSKAKTNSRTKEMTGRDFDALSDEEKQKIVRDLDNEPQEDRLQRSKPLTQRQRKQIAEWKRQRGGRPTIGKGAKVIALSVERDLLKQADIYAKAHKMKRSELVAKGLRAVMGLAS